MGFYTFTFTFHRLYYVVIQWIVVKEEWGGGGDKMLFEKSIRFFPRIRTAFPLYPGRSYPVK